ncbi:hypothetical protein GCM10011411_03580 [Aurantiacibacter arachoides]|nr:hypothetical protein GCM10011411_03580 [Aurantiacibacter arachoides]
MAGLRIARACIKLERMRCVSYVRRMLNIVSILVGLLSLVIVIPSQIPLLGIGNWLALPLLAVGIVIGQLSSKNTGRNLNLVILAIAVIRLMLGGGVL